MANESALGSAGTLLTRVRVPPSAPCRDGGPESLSVLRNSLVTVNISSRSQHCKALQPFWRTRTTATPGGSGIWL
ncbi:hypothetical protein PoB_004505200 [Plakobranchus ocellatus]|uniref:Uncharacterized protein n=1 Tax=Plakobranchus ocellatus TaxID=259542 RepID=A0AAV4BGN2_9GAST|nr:hypothetical protein PoB_004505200 [Plakobranchus ocellatus]